MNFRPRIVFRVGQFDAEPVVDHVREHLECETFRFRGVRLGGLGRELARLHERVALVPGEMLHRRKPRRTAGAETDVVGTVRPPFRVDEQLFAAGRGGRVHHGAAGRDHLD